MLYVGAEFRAQIANNIAEIKNYRPETHNKWSKV